MLSRTKDVADALSDSPALAYSIRGAVLASGLTRTGLFEALKTGRLDARKNGRRTIIMADSLRAYLASLPPIQRAGKPVQPQKAA